MAPGVMCRLDLPGNPSQPFHYRINLNYARAGAWGDILLLVRRHGVRGHTKCAKGAHGVAACTAQLPCTHHMPVESKNTITSQQQQPARADRPNPSASCPAGCAPGVCMQEQA